MAQHESMQSEAPAQDVPLVGSQYDFRISLGEKVGEVDTRTAIESGQLGFVHSFVTGSAVDGPGVRLVAWLSGCQFRCVYCHNPDTWKVNNGIPVPLARAVEQIQKYRHSLPMMKGGLTISGGEPLVQHRFVLNVFDAARKMGIHTALDSNGYLGERLTDADFAAIDLVLLDLKAMTPDLHRKLTGVDNEPIHKFARRLASRSKPVWVRFVLVPGWTDDMAEIDRIAAFAAELGNVERVDVLPFHQMGRFKWEKLAMDYKLRDTQPPSPEITKQAVERFRAVGLEAF